MVQDVENPDTTKFTRYWNDYVENNYRADHLDFVKYYENKPDIEIAFQFGPNMDLWAYHIFVIRKLDRCYLATRNYFRHARFTYKAYTIIHQNQVDSLYQVLDSINKTSIDTAASWNCSGYLTDNPNKAKYYIDFTKETKNENNEPKKEIKDLYDFVDNKIKWTTTYEL